MSVSPEEALLIAQEAYVFFYPMVESYRVMLGHVQEPSDTRINPRFNRLRHLEILDQSVETSNTDTAYSVGWLDLRAEPTILTLPPIPDKRYYSFLMVDGYTHNMVTLGARTTGHDGGVYMIAGPNWTGEKPNGVNEVYNSESQFVFLLGRTLVMNEQDRPNVTAIQEGYQLTLLHDFLGTRRPPIQFTPQFVAVDEAKLTELEFFHYANYIMTFITIHPDEAELFARFSRIGIIPGEEFPPSGMSPEVRSAVEEGISLGARDVRTQTLGTSEGLQPNGWRVLIDPPPFGPRSVLQGHYGIRATGALIGLYGNDLEETLYPIATRDSEGQILNGRNHKYTMRFTPSDIPEVGAFWSLTMYTITQQFVENEIDRFSIGDRTPSLHYAADGSLTVFIQQEKPQTAEEAANWLPSPNGIFYMVMRLYLPSTDAITAPPYVPPGVQQAD